MPLLDLLKTSLPSYPCVCMTELTQTAKTLTAEGASASTKLSAIKIMIECMVDEEIELQKLARKIILEKPSTFSIHLFLSVLHDSIDIKTDPLKILEKIVPDTPAIFASMVIYLIQKNISADAIVGSELLSNYLLTYFRDLKLIKSSYNILHKMMDKHFLNKKHKDELKKLFSLAQSTQIDVPGIGKYVLNGEQSDVPITLLPYKHEAISEIKLKTVPTADSVEKLEALFQYDFSDLKGAISEKEALMFSLYENNPDDGIPKHEDIIVLIDEYKRRRALKYHYLFLELIPKIPNKALVNLYAKKNKYGLSKTLPIRTVADYLTKSQINLLFKEGDLWTLIDLFYPAEAYITQDIVDRIIKNKITLKNIGHVINAGLNEPALIPYQDSILHQAFLFLTEHAKKGLIISDATALVTYEAFINYPKSLEWALSLDKTLKQELKSLIISKTQFDHEILESLMRFKEDQVEFVSHTTNHIICFPTYHKNIEPLMGFIIETLFEDKSDDKSLSSLLYTLFETDEVHINNKRIVNALYYCLASTKNTNLQKAIIDYLTKELKIENWIAHSFDENLTFIDKVFLYRNTSFFENHLFDAFFSEANLAFIINRLNDSSHMIKHHPIICFADNVDIIKGILSCYPETHQSSFFKDNELFAKILHFLVRGYTLHSKLKNSIEPYNTLSSFDLLLNRIPKEKRLESITSPRYDADKDDELSLLEQAFLTAPNYAQTVLDTLPKEHQFNAFKVNLSDEIHVHMIEPQDLESVCIIESLFVPDILIVINHAIRSYHDISQTIAAQESDFGRSLWFFSDKKIPPLPQDFITELMQYDSLEDTIKYLYHFLNTPENHRLLRECILYPVHDTRKETLSNSEFADKLAEFRKLLIDAYKIESLPEVNLNYQYVKPFVLPGFTS